MFIIANKNNLLNINSIVKIRKMVSNDEKKSYALQVEMKYNFFKDKFKTNEERETVISKLLKALSSNDESDKNIIYQSDSEYINLKNISMIRLTNKRIVFFYDRYDSLISFNNFFIDFPNKEIAKLEFEKIKLQTIPNYKNVSETIKILKILSFLDSKFKNKISKDNIANYLYLFEKRYTKLCNYNYFSSKFYYENNKIYMENLDSFLNILIKRNSISFINPDNLLQTNIKIKDYTQNELKILKSLLQNLK